ncbi:hypothetical protein OO006_10040 [Prosthecochloris sp. SCSIO W1101]|uniref:DUF1302 family protein n=1 Tax=Prosthecochloris sp. SCSIO W1101 TaxID=2992242 RepID=UPI00223CAC24|nr:DUF1302 family protein [Prosthecochloris sp. SCSIO W1101]UZJ40688.1 hypothetical protein OO006_10040 [Prosthecochloris sp. SCSIO W1101]
MKITLPLVECIAGVSAGNLTVGILVLLMFLPPFRTVARADDPRTDIESGNIQAPENRIVGDPFADDNLFSSDFADDSEETRASGNRVKLELHGYLESRNRLRTTDSEFISTRQRLWLEGHGSYGSAKAVGAEPPLRMFVSGAVDLDPGAADLSDDHETVRIYPEEAFLTIDRPGWNAVIGRKIHRIGTGDGINPLDLINPLDYRDPIATGRSDARLPVLLGLATINLPVSKPFQEANLDVIVVPLAQVNRLNSPGSAWESPGLQKLRAGQQEGAYILEDQKEPDQAFDQAEVEVRLAATLSGWDLSLIGFYGYLDSPVFEREYRSGPGSVQTLYVTPIHPDFSAFGFTFAKGLDRSTLRGELAVKPELPVMMKDDSLPGYTRTTVMEGVLGIDRTFGTNFYVNLQYFYAWTSEAENLINDTWAHGITYDVHDTFLQDDLEAGVRGILGFTGQGWTLEPYAEYQLADDWLFQGSLLFFEGPESGTYGQYDDNDLVTLRVRYSF